VTSKISSLPEVVGDAALLVDPYNTGEIADALARVLEEPTLRMDLIEKGHKRAMAFSWERSVTQIHDTYMKLLGVSVATLAAASRIP
jgi:glycosyltransferase involved in cell wall biosynthesis